MDTENIFYHIIIDYIDDDNFINSFSIINNHTKLQKRRIYINQKRAANMLIERFPFPQLYITPENSEDLIEYIKDMVESLNQETLLERSHIGHVNHRTMIIKNTVFMNIALLLSMNYDNKKEIIRNISNNIYNTEIRKNVKVCSTYRLPILHKRVLIKYFKNVLPLIY